MKIILLMLTGSFNQNIPIIDTPTTPRYPISN